MSGKSRIVLKAEIVEEYHEFKDDFKWSIQMRKKSGGYSYYSGLTVYKSAEDAYESLVRFLKTGKK